MKEELDYVTIRLMKNELIKLHERIDNLESIITVMLAILIVSYLFIIINNYLLLKINKMIKDDEE